jgi:hypothetical protein
MRPLGQPFQLLLQRDAIRMVRRVSGRGGHRHRRDDGKGESSKYGQNQTTGLHAASMGADKGRPVSLTARAKSWQSHDRKGNASLRKTARAAGVDAFAGTKKRPGMLA